MSEHVIRVQGEAVLIKDVQGITLKYGARKGQRMTYALARSYLPTSGKAPLPGDKNLWQVRLVAEGPVAFALERAKKGQAVRYTGQLYMNGHDMGGARITQHELNLAEVALVEAPGEPEAETAPAPPAAAEADPEEVRWDPSTETAEEFMARVERSLAPS